MEWTESKVLHLIELYREKEVLWNAKHPRHFNKIYKNDAWEEMASEMKTTGEECRKKLTTLLSSLRRERAKIKNSLVTGKGKDEVYQSNWFALKSLMFLWDKEKPRKTLTTIPVENVKESQTETDVDTKDEVPPQLPPVVRKRKRSIEDPRREKAFNVLATSASKKHEDGECQIFGSLIAKKMQKYSPETLSAVQHAVMTILFSADMGYYDQTPYPIPPSIYPTYSHHPQFSQHLLYPQHPQYPSSKSPSPSHHSNASLSTPSDALEEESAEGEG